ncbi:MAG: TonB family protein [Bacteroidota bacterium]|nr:TonB family protein [Bacteroidota bacterium]
MKQKLFALFFALSLFNGVAQTETQSQKSDTVFVRYENGNLISCDKDKAEGYEIKDEFNPNVHTHTIRYLQSDTPMIEYEEYDQKFKNNGNNVTATIPTSHGKYTEWYLSGEKRVECTYKENMLDGDFTVFYRNGKVKRAEKWKKGEWVSGECFDEDGNKTDYCSYQERASFVGGLPALYKYIGETLQYPDLAQKNGVTGIVYIKFIVNKDGSISDVSVDRGVHPVLDKEAVRVVKEMPLWKPGRFEGRLVSMEFTLPIRFSFK